MQARAVAGQLLTRAQGLANRNPWSSRIVELVARDAYNDDYLIAAHLHDFMEEPGFRAAYGRAVQASGWDYRIYWRVHVMLWAASVASHVDGAFVECGTGRGFMGSAICESLGWTNRPFFMFDTFEAEGLRPDAEQRDLHRNPMYAAGVEEVRANFAQWPGVQLVPGRIPESLDDVEIDHVALLHVDMNHPDPERDAVRHFWPKLGPGSVMVFDDYAHRLFRPIHENVDRLAAELGFDVVALPTGQGLVIKSR